ncbi:hypothetical protein SAMN04488128_103202 [Chitinophaga eiseniae]|uniref:Uncharacterized protein n=1 Tax=Chitinophaga eiseniae TaxID=634771 RepID=A0A1T4SP39_9BACT|nr:hypothetical protein [Chitinophaga eiseniae]SKA30009.1 hypothetical protein SAMN04488128_103202 [Chitinophaga eiseniae]
MKQTFNSLQAELCPQVWLFTESEGIVIAVLTLCGGRPEEVPYYMESGAEEWMEKEVVNQLRAGGRYYPADMDDARVKLSDFAIDLDGLEDADDLNLPELAAAVREVLATESDYSPARRA